MHPDPKHAALMLKIGLRDFKALQGMLSDPETFEDAIFGFHAQQCFEKFLKAALSQLGQDYPHTHDLHLLCRQLRQVASPPCELESLVPLTPFAVQFRYENDCLLALPVERRAILEKLAYLKQWLLSEIEILLPLIPLEP